MKLNRIAFFLLCLIPLFACKNEKQQSKDIEEVIIQEDSESLKDSSFVHSDSAIIKGKLYKAFMTIDYKFYLLRDKDTINLLEIERYLSPEFEFEDFNEDGNKDISFGSYQNIPLKEYYVFDSVTSNFNYIENAWDYSQLKKLKENYYYSYVRNGCADNDWLSYLVEIKDLKVIPLAYISGQGCDAYGKEGRKIEIFKLSKQDSVDGKLYQTLPINLIEKYEDSKWGFIKEYWSENYKKFVK